MENKNEKQVKINDVRGNLLSVITADFGDDVINLVQDAYCADDGSTYRAAAVGETTGDQYRITWDVLDGFDGDDESNACDWSCFTVERV